jgi:ribonuclease HI
MEVMAAFDAVRTYVDDPRVIRIVSDSNYVVKCFNDGWWRGWHARGWRNSQRQPVAHRDLWEPFMEMVLNRGRVEFEWVKGHSGDRMHDLVDALAVVHTQKRP